MSKWVNCTYCCSNTMLCKKWQIYISWKCPGSLVVDLLFFFPSNEYITHIVLLMSVVVLTICTFLYYGQHESEQEKWVIVLTVVLIQRCVKSGKYSSLSLLRCLSKYSSFSLLRCLSKYSSLSLLRCLSKYSSFSLLRCLSKYSSFSLLWCLSKYSSLSLLWCLIIQNAAYYDTRSISQPLQSSRNSYRIFR